MIELIALIFILVVLIYWPSLNGPPIWDDFTALDAQIRAGRVDTRWLNMRSVTRASWALTFRAARRWPVLDGPALHHLISALIHATVAISTIPIARALGLNEVVVALLVAVHPLAVSSIASVGQRASALSTMFMVLAVDAWLIVHPVASAPLLVLALMSKEDALGLISLAGLISKRYRDAFSNATAARHLVAAGQPSSLPFRLHLILASTSNLTILPLWVVGLAYDVLYPLQRHILPGLIIFMSLLYIQVTLVGWIGLTFWLSPFVLYWFVPLPHQVVDSRAYSLVVLTGLGLTVLLPNWLVVPTICWFAIQSTRLAWRYESPIRYWRSSSKSETSQINLAASLQSVGQLEEATKVLNAVVKSNPSSGIAWANLGLIYEAVARQHYVAASAEITQNGQRGPSWNSFVSNLKTAVMLLDRAHQLNPDDQSIRHYREHVRTLARELRVG